MKVACGIWLAMVVIVQAAGLDFPEIRKEIHAPPDVNVVTSEFDFTNHSDKTVTIVKYDAACSCMAVSIKGGKL